MTRVHCVHSLEAQCENNYLHCDNGNFACPITYVAGAGLATILKTLSLAH